MSHAEPTFDPIKLRRYPHMFPLDVVIWERFLEAYGTEYTGFDYDVKVGQGSDIVPGTPEKYARMQDILSKYRIDVVGYKASQISIIEVKPEASTVAIGQIVSYLELYKRDAVPTLPVTGVIISDHEVPDIRYLTNRMGIEYYVV